MQNAAVITAKLCDSISHLYDIMMFQERTKKMETGMIKWEDVINPDGFKTGILRTLPRQFMAAREFECFPYRPSSEVWRSVNAMLKTLGTLRLITL